jgi:hypothetical protein
LRHGRVITPAAQGAPSMRCLQGIPPGKVVIRLMALVQY